MKLRWRVLLTIGATGLTLFVALYSLTSAILTQSFGQLERREVEQAVQRIQEILANDLLSMNIVAHNWSSWGETLRYVAGENPAYEEENLHPQTFVNLRLNLLLILNASGQVRYGSAFDLEGQQPLPVPAGIAPYLAPGSRLLRNGAAGSSCTGLILLEEGPLLIAARPILPSSEEGAPAGTLLMGRYLGPAELSRLARQAGFPMRIQRLDEPALPLDFQFACSSFSEQKSIVVQPLNTDTVAGYMQLRDIDGRPIAVLRVDYPRTIFQQGQTVTLYLFLSLLVVTLAFGAAIVWLMERSVLRRLARLSAQVEQVQAGGDWNARVSVTGQDELTALGRAINGMLAEMGAALIERQESARSLQRRTEQLEALRQVGLEIGAQLDLQTLLRSIVARAIKLLGADDGGLYLYRPESDVLERVVSVGGTIPVGSILHRGEGLSGQVWASGQPLIVDDYQHWAGRAGVFQSEPTMSVVGVPVRWGEELLGILNVAATPPHTFTPGDAELLLLFAAQAAVALVNARLFAAERRRSEELEALRQASLSLASRLELQPVLEAILEHTLKLIQADDAHIFLYDGEKVSFGAALWKDGRRGGAYSIPREDGLTYAVARGGQRIVAPNVNEHPLYRNWAWGGAIAGLPLRSGERVLGVMNVAFDKPHPFDADELRVLELLADQAAVAIENAQLYSDLQQQMEQLKSTQAQLVQSARLVAVGELAAGVAHELNNSLTPIMGFAALLLEELPADSPYRPDVEKITAKARQASEIVRNLLDFARQVKPQKQVVNINDILRKTLALIRTHLEKNGLVIEEVYDQDLESLPIDAGQMGQVLLNLINNAAQAMPEGGELRLRTYRSGDGVAIAISDTGEGIPAADQARIFEPFFTTRPDRAGLGLAVSLGIVQEHGGRITVESEPGRGSTFTVWIPIVGKGVV